MNQQLNETAYRITTKEIVLGYLRFMKRMDKQPYLNQIAEDLGKKKTFISRIMKELVEVGFIDFNLKGAKKEYHLTKKGKKHINDSYKHLRLEFVSLASFLKTEDLEELLAIQGSESLLEQKAEEVPIVARKLNKYRDLIDDLQEILQKIFEDDSRGKYYVGLILVSAILTNFFDINFLKNELPIRELLERLRCFDENGEELKSALEDLKEHKIFYYKVDEKENIYYGLNDISDVPTYIENLLRSRERLGENEELPFKEKFIDRLINVAETYLGEWKISTDWIIPLGGPIKSKNYLKTTIDRRSMTLKVLLVAEKEICIVSQYADWIIKDNIYLDALKSKIKSENPPKIRLIIKERPFGLGGKIWDANVKILKDEIFSECKERCEIRVVPYEETLYRHMTLADDILAISFMRVGQSTTLFNMLYTNLKEDLTYLKKKFETYWNASYTKKLIIDE